MAMSAGKGKATDNGRRNTLIGTTSITKIMTTNILHCTTEVVVAEIETERGRDCLHYLEIIPLRVEEEEEEKTEVSHLTILHPLLQQE